MAVADVGVISPTGNSYIDAIMGDSVWANSGGGSPVELTYSFQTGSVRFDGVRYDGAVWESYETEAFEVAFANFESVINVTFTQSSGDTDLRFFSVDEDEFLGAQYGPEGVSDDGLGIYSYIGDGWDVNGLQQGGYGYVTVIHELGHAMGLGHPHDDGFNTELFPGLGFDDAFDTGQFELNQGIFTVMSYNSGYDEAQSNNDNYGYEGTLGAFDIYALQQMYGANTSYNTGNNVYLLDDTTGKDSYWMSIWDAGGTDAISAEGSTVDSVIDIREAPLTGANAAGFISQAGNVTGGFTIANGVTIEQALGGEGDDTLTGNGSGNLLRGNGGGDQLFGQDGDDDLNGNQGNDTVLGEGGNDTARGGQGDDSVDGGAGDDSVLGDIGNDTLFGSGGNDYMNGGRYASYAGNDSDFLSGGEGDDFAQGNLESDRINGDSGNDTLRGGQGDDILDGGTGNDHLYGDKGSDTLIGGSGTDTAFFQGSESDYSVVTDGGTTTLTHSDGTVDVISEIEEVQFMDGGGFFL
ncbi:hypothetical protein ACTL6U_13630 [Rhodovibrionaceae bacterium A322]